MLHHASPLHPFFRRQQDGTFALADKVAGDRHRGPFVSDFGMFGNDFSDNAGGVEENPGSGTEMQGSHFTKCGTGGELKSSKLAGLNEIWEVRIVFVHIE